MSFIPVNEPLLDGREKEYLIECIDTGWISSEGPFVRQFEERIAERAGRRFGIAVNNGTAAVEAAVAALGIGAGDEVILTTFTIISCALAVIRAGARPVFVDVDPLTWNMDVSAVESVITPRTRAVMAVHTYGMPIDMGPLMAIAGKHGLAVIEDAAQLLGQDYRGRPCGSFGEISTFSFYPNKHVTTGEGGMLVTDDEGLAERCRSLRNLCFQPDKRFVHEELGWNMRMSNVQAAIGLAQLERLDEFVSRKRAMGRRYSQQLSGVQGLQLPLASNDYAENIYWVYGLVLDDNLEIDASAAIRKMSALDIGTRPFFWPMHEQPVLRESGWVSDVSLPVAERIARRGFYLPGGLALSDSQIDRVTGAVREIIN